MPVPFRGVLRVKTIQGRSGTFAVGDLETEIGKFRIKDATLDQFQAGVYHGVFWISEIYHSSYVTGSGHMIIELRARTSAMQIDDEDTQNPPASGLVEQDPLDEERKPPQSSTPPPESPAPKKLKRVIKPIQSSSKADNPAPDSVPDDPAQPNQASQPSSESVERESDAALFGPEMMALIVKLEPIKLDPTVDRAILRQQAARLVQLQYAFKSQQQTWLFSPAS